MNIEEAKANIGKEVVLLPETKPYLGNMEYCDYDYELLERKDRLTICCTTISGLVVIDDRAIHPQHIKLKEEKKMKEFKIKVANEVESKEVQDLLFELGYKWGTKGKGISYVDMPALTAWSDRTIAYIDHHYTFGDCDKQEITINQLRDLVVLQRNNVSDATHTDNVNKFYICKDGEVFQCHDGVWIKCSNAIIQKLKPLKEVKITWQQALRYIADGKDVQYFDYEHDKWLSIKNKHLNFIMNDSLTFQLAPPTIHLEEGDYTKEELLKIAGEMK